MGNFVKEKKYIRSIGIYYWNFTFWIKRSGERHGRNNVKRRRLRLEEKIARNTENKKERWKYQKIKFGIGKNVEKVHDRNTWKTQSCGRSARQQKNIKEWEENRKKGDREIHGINKRKRKEKRK